MLAVELERSLMRGEDMPGNDLVLQPRRAHEIAPGSRADAIEVGDAEMLVEFVSARRQYAGELAVNEATARSYSELQQYLETGTKILLDALRHAGDTSGRSDSRRSTPRSGCAESCSEPIMPGCWRSPSRSPCRPARPSASRREREQRAIAAPRFPLRPH